MIALEIRAFERAHRSLKRGSGMLRRRIKSALYIDFENVPLPPDAIASWLAWLEDGAFDPSLRRRRFLQKRVYWNSHAERHRELFRFHGFVPVLVGKFSGLKNGADIRMAMDVVEATYTRSEIDEFILLTGDSDFVPVLERLREKSKRSAIVVTEHRPNIHTTYQLSADVLIPSRRLTEAAHYRRPPPGLLGRLIGRRAVSPPRRPPTLSTGPSTRQAGSSRPVTTAASQPPPLPNGGEPPAALDMAAKIVWKLLAQQPRNYVSQRRIIAELERVPGFKRQGSGAFLGTGSYRTLMHELARIETRITVIEQPGGGTGIVYAPPEPPSPAGANGPSTGPPAKPAPLTPTLSLPSSIPAAQVSPVRPDRPRLVAQSDQNAQANDPLLPVEPSKAASHNG
jgi:hypothetical protein